MKKILFVIIIIALVLIINNLGQSIYNLWHKKDLVVKAEQELLRQKQENKKLKLELSYVESRDFIEKEARNKLLLVKQGEQQVVVSQGLVKGGSAEEKENKDDPNWRKWWKLFF